MKDLSQKTKFFPTSHRLFRRGFTLIEILVVFAVVVALFSVVSFKFADMREQQVFKNSVIDTVSSINKARTQTLSSILSSNYGVHFQADKVIIFKGTVFSESSGDNEIIEITSPANISDVTLGGVSGASGDFYFNRLSGAPSKTGTVTISANALSKTLTISATGSVSTN